jgi:quinol-cytochrome oxidoreductase complex cytochrome b subunit
MATTSRTLTRPTARELVVDPPLEWVEERSGWLGLVEAFLFRNVPRDTSWLQTLGSSLLTVFLMQAITGVILAMYYTPSPNGAYESIRYITDQATLGWLVRGMHKWGASVMVILLFLHMARAFFFAGYKYPRELTWLTGAILFLLVMAMALTGYLLVWDQRAYWATTVAVNINGTAPILGPYLADFLKSGGQFNADTLSRFYSLHMLVIPGGIFTFIFLHLWLVVKLGVTSPPWSRDRYDEDAAREAVEASR